VSDIYGEEVVKDAEKGRGLLLVTFASVVVAMLTLAGPLGPL
jgi:hypothetical protein